MKMRLIKISSDTSLRETKNASVIISKVDYGMFSIKYVRTVAKTRMFIDLLFMHIRKNMLNE